MDADKMDFDWRPCLARFDQILALRRLGSDVFACDWCNRLEPADTMIQVYCEMGTFVRGEHCSLRCAIEYAKSESDPTSLAAFISPGLHLGFGDFTKKGHFLLSLNSNGDHIWIKERVRQLQDLGELA